MRSAGFLKKTSALILAAVMLIGIAFAQPVAEVHASDTLSSSSAASVKPTNWMSAIAGDTKLSAMTIPGTHDSATQYIFPGFFLNCQNSSFAEQLDNGYRYFDIRVGLDETDNGMALTMIHNFGNCRKGFSFFSGKLYLDDVLEDMYSFLEENDTETIIFCVKAENSDDDVADVANVLYQLIEQNPDMWYLENRIPTLDEVRGKIVLATRWDDVNQVGEENRGLNFQWDDQNNTDLADVASTQSMINDTEQLWVQDRYKYNIEQKEDAFTEAIENSQASDDTFQLNFLSTSGSGKAGHPKRYAKYINEKLLETELQPQTGYGVIIVDFGTKKLAEHIYASNFLHDGE